jgi:16S rRNA processing protein RimM
VACAAVSEALARPRIMNWDDMVLVGRVARTHGLRGDVVVNPETDFVAERFRPGATMWIRSGAGEEQLTVTAVRLQNGRPVVAFEGFSSIDSAGRLTGQELRVPEASLQPLASGQYYEHQLAGCSVATVGGEEVGVVDRVERGAGGSRLVVRGDRGEVLVPLVEHICREIDVEGRRIRIDPPEGLLELNESKRNPQ